MAVSIRGGSTPGGLNGKGGGMSKRTSKTKGTSKTKVKAMPKKGRAWFERKVAELKTDLDKLSEDRQEQLNRELKEGSEQ